MLELVTKRKKSFGQNKFSSILEINIFVKFDIILTFEALLCGT